MRVILGSTVLVFAERSGRNPQAVINELVALLGDTEVALSAITIAELAHGIERANSALNNLAIGTTALEPGYAVAKHNVLLSA